MNRDAVVVGAGPAGLSAAIGLARSGYGVTVLEQRAQWQERVCGAFMNPEAVAHMKWLGVLDAVLPESVSVPDVSVTYGRFEQSVPIGVNGCGALALPRKSLEEALLAHAQHENVEVKMGVRHVEVDDRLTVYADGRFSGGLVPRSFSEGGWYGWNATFDGVRRKPGNMSLNFYPGGYVGTLTFADGRTNICGLVRRHKTAPLHWEKIYGDALASSPFLAEMMTGSAKIGEWRGVGPLPFSSTLREADGGALRVGDAGAVGDPFMGEGNGRALGAGPLLWETLRQSPSSDRISSTYRDLWNEAYRTRFRIGYWSRAALARPFLFSFVARFLLGNPDVLRRATPYFHKGFLVKVEAVL